PVTQPYGQFAIGDGLAAWDLADEVPHAVLELVAVDHGRQVEISPGAVQVHAYLVGGLGEQLVVGQLDPGAQGVIGGPVPVVVEVEADDRVVGGDEGDLTQRCGVDGCVA